MTNITVATEAKTPKSLFAEGHSVTGAKRHRRDGRATAAIYTFQSSPLLVHAHG